MDSKLFNFFIIVILVASHKLWCDSNLVVFVHRCGQLPSSKTSDVGVIGRIESGQGGTEFYALSTRLFLVIPKDYVDWKKSVNDESKCILKSESTFRHRFLTFFWPLSALFGETKSANFGGKIIQQCGIGADKMADGGRKPRTASRSKCSDKDKVRCIICCTSLDSKSPSVQCDNCENWVCLNCSKISKALYDELSKCDGNVMEFLCSVCRSTKTNLKTIGKSIIDLKNSSEARLDRVEDRIEALESTVKETVHSEVGIARSSLKEELAETIDSIVEGRLKELELRKSRSMNLMIFKMELSKSELASERKEHDYAQINKLFKSICPDRGDLNIKTCFRLMNRKKPQNQQTDCPPIKLILNDKAQRRQFLLQSRKIASLADESLKEVIIARDLTLDQRNRRKSRMDSKRTDQEGEESSDSFQEG